MDPCYQVLIRAYNYVSSSIVQHSSLLGHGHVQIAVVQHSVARHSELVTNIATICVAIRHCQLLVHTENGWLANYKEQLNLVSLHVHVLTYRGQDSCPL